MSNRFLQSMLKEYKLPIKLCIYRDKHEMHSFLYVNNKTRTKCVCPGR